VTAVNGATHRLSTKDLEVAAASGDDLDVTVEIEIFTDEPVVQDEVRRRARVVEARPVGLSVPGTELRSYGS